MPIVSDHFNVFLELPLKIIIRKYKYKIILLAGKVVKLVFLSLKLVNLVQCIYLLFYIAS